ncbi:ATP-binding protein [Roseicyclus persicicus]|uniref:ATP-binding protein n=1 Tax=Roseicyclus persicicus TaxID=2650661 RepID=A0A7X6H052_9RHOB|nr:ATP-binding protein [Roseibacterium persicicum]NKX45556.1 ATP-binding protein [Roseibacterium persicicum]
MSGPTGRQSAPPRLSLRFAGEDAAVRRSLAEVEAGLAAAGVGDGLRQRAQIALAEACNNIVEHAYGPARPRPGPIALDILVEAGGLRVMLRDKGRAMPPGPLPGDAMPELSGRDPMDLPEGGFGWALLRRIAEDLHHERTGDRNTLRFLLPAVEKPRKPGELPRDCQIPSAIPPA